MRAKKNQTPAECIARVAYVAHLPEVGSLATDLASLRGKADRIEEMRRQIASLEDDLLRGAQRLHEEAGRLWSADEIRAAKDVVGKARA